MFITEILEIARDFLLWDHIYSWGLLFVAYQNVACSFASIFKCELFVELQCKPHILFHMNGRNINSWKSTNINPPRIMVILQ